MLHIFLPGKTAGTTQNLIDAGLGLLLRPDDDQPGCTDLVAPYGPEGLPGQVWSWGAAKYDPASQTWHKARGANYWYGFDNGQAAPAALKRKDQLGGKVVRLGGERWTLSGADTVPHRIDLNPQGELCKLPDTPYADFADEAGQLLAVFADFMRNQVNPESFNWQRQVQFVVSALALNYRINTEIATRLGLLLDVDLWDLVVLAAAADQVQAVFADLDSKKSGRRLWLNAVRRVKGPRDHAAGEPSLAEVYLMQFVS